MVSTHSFLSFFAPPSFSRSTFSFFAGKVSHDVSLDSVISGCSGHNDRSVNHAVFSNQNFPNFRVALPRVHKSGFWSTGTQWQVKFPISWIAFIRFRTYFEYFPQFVNQYKTVKLSDHIDYPSEYPVNWEPYSHDWAAWRGCEQQQVLGVV
jgi:hypothetical protein